MELTDKGKDFFHPDIELIITSVLPVEDGLYLSGSIKEEHYKVVLIKLDSSFEIEYQKEFSNSETSDYEGHNMIIQDDSLLIAGCSEGIATPEGGSDWKVYLLKTSLTGEKEWDNSFRLLGNECAYGVVSDGNTMLLCESKSDGMAQLFILCLDQQGKLLWKRSYAEGAATGVGGMVSTNDGYIFSGSIKKNDNWNLNVFKIDKSGKTLWKSIFPDFYVFKMCKNDSGFLIVGKKSGHVSLINMDNSGNMLWESTFDKGSGISIATINEHIYLGGEVKIEDKEKPIIYKLDKKGNQIEKLIFEKDGWIETMAEFQGSLAAIIFGLTPKDHTELVQIKVQ